jgi:hypothetical protein
MVGKTEVVVFNHDFEGWTLQDGGPSAANPELDSWSCQAVLSLAHER